MHSPSTNEVLSKFPSFLSFDLLGRLQTQEVNESCTRRGVVPEHSRSMRLVCGSALTCQTVTAENMGSLQKQDEKLSIGYGAPMHLIKVEVMS